MARREIRGYRFDSTEILGACPDGDGPLVEDFGLPFLAGLTAEEVLDFEIGLLKVGYCPQGRHFRLLRPPPVVEFSAEPLFGEIP